MAEHPAEVMRRAAALLSGLAEAASPGPWHQMCMGSEGCSVLNDGRLRDRRHVSFSGRKEWKADHADAGYIAAMHPGVGLVIAGWLEEAARRCEENVSEDRPECAHDDCCSCEKPLLFGCDFCGEWLVAKGCACWDGAMATARVILGEADGNG